MHKPVTIKAKEKKDLDSQWPASSFFLREARSENRLSDSSVQSSIFKVDRAGHR